MLRNRRSNVNRNQPTIYPLAIDPRRRLRFVTTIALFNLKKIQKSSIQSQFLMKMFFFFFFSGSHRGWLANNDATNKIRIVFCHDQIINNQGTHHILCVVIFAKTGYNTRSNHKCIIGWCTSSCTIASQQFLPEWHFVRFTCLHIRRSNCC